MEPASSPCQAPPGYWGEDDPPRPPLPTMPSFWPDLLKRGLLLAWAVWLTVVFFTNLADAAKAAGLLGADWSFASGNYRAVTETTARYRIPAWMNALLFAGVIAWEGLAAILFWRALYLIKTESARSATLAAFTVSLLLWAAFMIADEVFIAYAIEGSHIRLFIAYVGTLLVMERVKVE